VVSRRVIFIIDISGSMEDSTRGQFVGETGESRMDVAKRELDECLDSLDVDSLFNIIAFSASALAWQDRVSEWTTVSLEEAKDYIRRQQAYGGTNLFGALEIAFDDPMVDTIYVLSDGMPTVGVTDPTIIRETVADWNRYRGVKLHGIAVGGDLETLEWLAEDSGGQYVRIP
jgi:Mg-chelatase subunit ChlD